MSNVVYIEELILARKVVQEVPDAIKALDSCVLMCYSSSHYIDMAKVILQIEESKLMLELILETYMLFLKQNGVKSE